MADEKKWKKVETAPTWDFKVDQEFEGVFVNVETEVGPNKSNLYNFRVADGTIVAIWGNTILDSRFKNLSEGDEVKVIFLGKAKSPKTNREYNNFDVFKAEKEIQEGADAGDDIDPKDIPF
jgi:hypothetical protein